MKEQHYTEMTTTNQQQDLIELSRNYLSGKISLEDFSEREKKLITDYSGATFQLAKTQTRLRRILSDFLRR